MNTATIARPVVLAAALALAGCALSHVSQGEVDAGFDAPPIDVPDGRVAEGGRDVPIDAGDVHIDARDVPIVDAREAATCDASCGGTCVDLSTDLHHCGSCGNDCAPAGGHVNATSSRCVAGVCNVVCDTGFLDCDRNASNGCEASTTDNAHCGSCTVQCTAPRMCAADSSGTLSCVLNCPSGQMICNGACIDTSINDLNCGSCNTACVAPANGSSHCMGSNCVAACESGFHLCGTSCAADSDTNQCGPTCQPCTPPANAVPVCNGGCDFACNPGFHKCGSGCVDDNDVATCGTSCTPCSVPPLSMATCVAGACGSQCLANTHQCPSGACAADDDATQCGSPCTPCQVPANGNATCISGSCGITCNGGFHACGTMCADNSSANSCGSSCAPCGAVTNGTAGCNGTGCVANCNTGYVASAYTCVSPDSCSGPATVNVSTGTPVTFTGTTNGASDDTSHCGGTAGPDVVYAIVPQSTGTLNVTLTITPARSWGGGIYASLACGGSFLGCDAAGGSGTASLSIPIAVAPVTVYVTVDGTTAADHGPFTLTADLQ